MYLVGYGISHLFRIFSCNELWRIICIFPNTSIVIGKRRKCCLWKMQLWFETVSKIIKKYSYIFMYSIRKFETLISAFNSLRHLWLKLWVQLLKERSGRQCFCNGYSFWNWLFWNIRMFTSVITILIIRKDCTLRLTLFLFRISTCFSAELHFGPFSFILSVCKPTAAHSTKVKLRLAALYRGVVSPYLNLVNFFWCVRPHNQLFSSLLVPFNFAVLAARSVKPTLVSCA